MYSFFRLSQMNFQVVLSACSPYFRDILRGISAWQHPVIVLKDVPYSDLQVSKINNSGRLVQLTKFLKHSITMQSIILKLYLFTGNCGVYISWRGIGLPRIINIFSKNCTNPQG